MSDVEQNIHKNLLGARIVRRKKPQSNIQSRIHLEKVLQGSSASLFQVWFVTSRGDSIGFSWQLANHLRIFSIVLRLNMRAGTIPNEDAKTQIDNTYIYYYRLVDDVWMDVDKVGRNTLPGQAKGDPPQVSLANRSTLSCVCSVELSDGNARHFTKSSALLTCSS
jgi:hypothetical protein